MLDDFVLSYLPLVRSIARKVKLNLPESCPVELADLVQAGFVGLLAAARNYQSDGPVSFSVYATPRIKGEMLDLLRRLDTAPRALRQWQKRTEHARERLASKLHRQPTDVELSEHLGVETSTLLSRQYEILQRTSVTLENPSGEICAGPEYEAHRLRIESERRALVDMALEALPERLRQVVLLYDVRGMTMKDIGREMRISESAVSQMRRRALKMLAQVLEDVGIKASDVL